jgi:hypothetical protein
MITKTTYKKQGNGQDSWIINYDDKIPEIVFKDPTIEEKVNISNIDLTTLTSEHVAQLKAALGL